LLLPDPIPEAIYGHLYRMYSGICSDRKQPQKVIETGQNQVQENQHRYQHLLDDFSNSALFYSKRICYYVNIDIGYGSHVNVN